MAKRGRLADAALAFQGTAARSDTSQREADLLKKIFESPCSASCHSARATCLKSRRLMVEEAAPASSLRRPCKLLRGRVPANHLSERVQWRPMQVVPLPPHGPHARAGLASYAGSASTLTRSCAFATRLRASVAVCLAPIRAMSAMQVAADLGRDRRPQSKLEQHRCHSGYGSSRFCDYPPPDHEKPNDVWFDNSFCLVCCRRLRQRIRAEPRRH